MCLESQQAIARYSYRQPEDRAGRLLGGHKAYYAPVTPMSGEHARTRAGPGFAYHSPQLLQSLSSQSNQTLFVHKDR